MRKIRGVIAIALTIITVAGCLPINVFAAQKENQAQEQKSIIGETGGYLVANKSALQKMRTEAKFTSQTGHGFAAERGNNLIDIYHGKKATVVGDDNVKNGADRRIVNRDGSKVWIQDKYYKTATDSINACFDDTGMFRYFDADGKPMQIEVPKDQYDDAVSKLADKIREGKIKGVTNPDEAQNIVKKGNLTYKQAVNITKAGNIDSLKYDAQNGIITASAAVGISFLLDYAVCLINGHDYLESLEIASLHGLKTGSVIFCTYVISSQLAKSGLSNALVPASEAVAKSLGKDVAKSILQTSGVQTAGMSTATQTARVANILKNQAIFATVTVVVLSTGDVIEVFQGRISKEQLLSNLAVTIVSVAGGTAGYYVGGAIGTAISPGVGTTIGSIVGGALIGTGSAYLTDWVAGLLYEGDAEKMYDIVVNEFQTLGEEYLVNEAEAQNVATALSKKLSGDTLKDMFESDSREKFARKLIEPLFEKEIAKRKAVETPSEEEIRTELKQNLQGVALVH